MQAAATKFRVEVQGAPLPAEADTVLLSAVVDDSLNLPDLFILEFRDNHRDLLSKTGIGIGAAVRISVGSEAAPGASVLIHGEVTALETEYDKAGTRTVVRGFDASHRLLRGRMTRTWQNATLSDVAVDVARSAGLEIDKVDATTAVVDHVTQANISNWDFLRWLGREARREVVVLNGKLQFRESTESADGPKPGTLVAQDPLQLKLGENLRQFRAIITSAEQVEEVQARGWDVKRKAALVGTAAAKTTSAQLQVGPADLARRFGAALTFVGVDTPFGVQQEVDDAAIAMADQIAGAFAEFDGVADGNPKLRAGAAVSLGSIGQPFEGKYVLTTTRHVYTPTTGYTTWFTVSGKQERSLLGLAAGSGTGVASPGGPRIAGVVNALVTDVRDPERLGRVRLKFPWLSNDYVSDWSRVAQMGAGEKGRGSIVIPEVNDEVLVSFEQGDIRRPYVIGGLYNGVDPPRSDAIQEIIDPATGAVTARHFFSRKGHQLSFVDKDGSEGITLQTDDHKFTLRLSKSDQVISIASDGKIEIKGTGDVSIESSGSTSLKAAARLSLEAGAGISISGGPMVEITGGLIKLN
jgi:phage protein D/phage baseplate assembly protein gpV